MSNKMDAVEMDQDAKRELKPKIRFPEFQDGSAWEVKKLEDIASFYKGKGISKADIDLHGEILCIRYGELYTIYSEVIKTVFSKTKLPASELFFSQKNDVLIPSSGETKLDIAKASCILLNNVALGGDLNILRSKDNGIFLSYLLNGPYKREIAKKAQGDTVVHLYANQLKLLEVVVPKEAEQTKIADCLSSFDELIAAQSQKIDGLKAHKKGLLQQLFPAEGETLPKIRFPEFRDAPAWGVKKIGELAKVTTGSKDTQNKVDDGAYPFFVRSQTVERINSFSYDGEAILTSGDGVGVGKNFHYIIGKFDFHQRVYCIYDFDSTVLGKYIYIYFSEYFYQRVMQLSAKNSVDSVRMSMISEMPILLPGLDEQTKIADCLSSLDELIAAQSQKLELLKAHKKGLMQQLFPSPDEG